MMTLNGLILLLGSIAILIPGCLGVFLLVTSSDQLTIRYQNYMLNKTMKPLKDEDFSHVTKIIIFLKVLGLVLVIGSTFLVLNMMNMN